MSAIEFIEELEELSSAEEFLEYFHIEFDPATVMVNRLHIMQRYHDYLQQARSSGVLPRGGGRAEGGLSGVAGASLPGLCGVRCLDGEGVQGVPHA